MLNHQKIISKLSTIKTAIAPIALAIFAGSIFDQLNFLLGWLLGPMVARIIYTITKGRPQSLPKMFVILGEAIIALATAFRFSPETMSAIGTYILPVMGYNLDYCCLESV